MAVLLVRYCVPINPFPSFHIKEEEIEVNGFTLKDLIDKLILKYGKDFGNFVLNPKTGALQDSIMILINGVHAKSLGGLNAKLKDKDYVVLLPPIGGG